MVLLRSISQQRLASLRTAQGETMRRSFTQSAIIIGIFSALAAAGGLIKIPSPVGSIAFDSAPGYFVAAFYGPALGSIVGFIGHLASAAVAGMPLGPMHLVVAIAMV